MRSDIRYVGWDIGGAHLKVALLDGQGQLCGVETYATPLWEGTGTLTEAMNQVHKAYSLQQARHAVTMTGELADCFTDRAEGVRALLELFYGCFPRDATHVYAGLRGFLDPEAVEHAIEFVASANWHAMARLAAKCYPRGLLIDVGSTTTDLVWFHDGRVRARGSNDRTRLTVGELVYTGVVRTPVIALATAVPFRGLWVELATEHFATAADVYRLNGELPAGADLGPTADGRDKSQTHSEARLARMLGTGASEGSTAMWKAVADYLAECQVQRITRACQLQISRGIDAKTPMLGSGVGRFLVERIAQRLGRTYRVFDPLPVLVKNGACSARGADMGPAVAVASLLKESTQACVF
ncbi:MAG: hydantoinase/oxoprolinase family protein [Pirellulaceae bacterium]